VRVRGGGSPVLGIGHGARVLTLALGGVVKPAVRPLRGWAMVDTAVSPLIAGGPWLTWLRGPYLSHTTYRTSIAFLN
jgi:GMP synthase-like glutamine amidotransferase